ncbi:Mis6-domain-containing protein, partial [Peziza echinospora]
MPSGGSRSELVSPALRHVLDTLRRASARRIDVPKEQVHEAADDFVQYASINGLTDETLDAVIDILTTPSKLDQVTISAVIKALYPRNKVPEAIVVKVVGCFGHGESKPSLRTQAGLLRWLVMVYDVMAGYTMLSQLYGILFNMLQMITLRAHICHLLSLLTRRKHVKPFRIQALLELKRVVGIEPPLLGLLQIYKDYYPDVIVERLPPVKSGLFSHPNPEWMGKLRFIQEAQDSDPVGNTDLSTFQIARKHGGKRRKTTHFGVPEVRTYGAVEASATLEEITNVEDFVAKLDKLELPNQLAAVVEDPLLQQLLNLRFSDIEQQRVNNWISAYLSSGIGSHSSGLSDWVKDYLPKLLRYTEYTKTLLPAVEKFLEISLSVHKDIFESDHALELLTFLALRSYNVLHDRFFQPLNRILQAKPCKLIGFYTELLRYWLVMHGTHGDASVPVEAEECIAQYILHVGELCVGALQENQQNTHVRDSALGFFEVVALFPVGNSTFRLVLPPNSLVYDSLYSGEVLAMSRMCGILARYKHIFEETRKRAAAQGIVGGPEYSRAFTTGLDGFTTDVCSCIWLNRGFVDDPHSLGFGLSKQVIGQLGQLPNAQEEELKHLYSLTRSFALAPFSAEILGELEGKAGAGARQRHRGPPTQDTLKLLASNGGLQISWRDYKKEVLSGLEQRGYAGMSELMYSVITTLSSDGRG